MTPASAQVFIDSYYVGTVEDIDAQRVLRLEAGPHRIEMRAPEYRTLTVDVRVLPLETVTYRGALEPVRPQAATTPAPAAAGNGDVLDPEVLSRQPAAAAKPASVGMRREASANSQTAGEQREITDKEVQADWTLVHADGALVHADGTLVQGARCRVQWCDVHQRPAKAGRDRSVTVHDSARNHWRSRGATSSGAVSRSRSTRRKSSIVSMS